MDHRCPAPARLAAGSPRLEYGSCRLQALRVRAEFKNLDSASSRRLGSFCRGEAGGEVAAGSPPGAVRASDRTYPRRRLAWQQKLRLGKGCDAVRRGSSPSGAIAVVLRGTLEVSLRRGGHAASVGGDTCPVDVCRCGSSVSIDTVHPGWKSPERRVTAGGASWRSRVRATQRTRRLHPGEDAGCGKPATAASRSPSRPMSPSS